MKRTMALALCLCAVLCVCASAADDGPPELPPGASIGVTPGYTRHEPGHWELTGVLVFGPLEKTREAEGVTVTAEARPGDKSADVVYTFEDGAGAKSSYTVTPYWFDDFYYADSSFAVGVNMVRSPDEDGASGSVSASLAVADAVVGEGDYGFQPTVRSYFKLADGTVIERFGIQENMTRAEGSEGKYYIDLRGELPVGEEAGQKIYAVLGVQDDIDRGTRVFVAYQYEWVDQPEDIEVPPEYGPIEYHNDPVSVISRYPVLILIPLLLIAAIVIFAVRRRRRKQ